MEIILQTKRLLLRELNLNDSPFIVKLLNSPSWLKYIGDRGVKSEEDAKVYLQNGPLLSYEKHGFGLYLVELLSSKVPIGMCGILKRDSLEHPDLGFAFLSEYTGQGYAFEIANATVSYAKDKIGISTLFAITLPHNRSSIRLLEKIGMKYIDIVKSPDGKDDLNLYRLELKEE